MKRWTVMVIPQGQGSTKTLHLSSLHSYMAYAVAGVLIVAVFSSTFLYQRYAVARHEADVLRQQQRESQLVPVQPADRASLTAAERAEVERQVREEYERRNAAILAELSELYDIESEVRTIHGLPPRETAQSGPLTNLPASGGKGGGPSAFDAPGAELAEMIRPPSLIYGLSQPPLDLLAEEIMLRKESLSELVGLMEDKKERIEHTPSIWPSNHPSRRLTSTFGVRRDPITRGFRHHDGTDISAVIGSPVLSTAKGKVTFAEYDRFYGNLVKIDHGSGVETWYGHMSEILVTVGSNVERGQQIGKVGSTGRSTGAHIHYEVHLNGVPVDSGKYLGNK